MDKKINKEKTLIKCAIYTRVSTSEGLEQEFTSLDNQRESAESYIQSQKSEGWIALPECYNDGGFTGANTDRPALQKLIENIKAHRINCIVVYKVDRLSRSLLDFSQLLEFFDQNSVTFVSVTQHFNTNNSMGRLTLNILLSFAQFEREIISERTRDKMGAARKKGKWIGGCIPLGYNLDKENHKLLINPEEARIVQELFSLYLKEHSLLEVTKIANSKGYRTKIRKLTEGKQGGGVKFSSTSMEKILKSAYYAGKVKYQNELYPGEHERIINDETFMKVQNALHTNPAKFGTRKPIGKKLGLLSRILRCKACNSSMYLAHSVKHGVLRYSHYVCLNAQKRGYQECPTRLVNTGLMESKIMEFLRKLSDDQRLTPDTWESSPLSEKRIILKDLVKEIRYDGGTGILEIVLNSTQKTHAFNVSKAELKYHAVTPKDRLIQSEPQLCQNLLLAHQIQDLINKNKAKGIKEVSGWLNLSHVRMCQIMGMLFLCPEIQEQILLSRKEKIFDIPEYKVNEIAKELSWTKQKDVWKNLMERI
ncbi:MAG: recombinase family protein [Candidatus Gygaella obscura]|nr:recombinase family protein [Candidatus Gygaella obscura]